MTALNHRQRRFVENLADGQSAIDAYKNAGYQAKTDKVASNNAARLMENDGICGYLRQLQQQRAEASGITFAWVSDKLVDIVSIALGQDKPDYRGATGALSELNRMHGYHADMRVKLSTDKDQPLVVKTVIDG